MKSILDKSGHDHFMEISDQSNILSGGEKQCIGFARALYDARSIIALDEATASMDYDLAHRVVSSILKKWETVICITHQSFLLPYFKKIIVMHDGEIQDSGTYDEVFARNEFFRYLCNKTD
jgi:ABC-type bacteriocin/lantibiotic exporter with double-glycine peptidase domain